MPVGASAQWREPFPSHPLVWTVLAGLLVMVIVARPGTAPQPAASVATPVLSPSPPRVELPIAERARQYAWLSRASLKSYEPLVRRIDDPPGFRRVAVVAGGFDEWLRHLPVQPAGAPVRNGQRKTVVPGDAPSLAAVVDLQPGNSNLLTAANIVLRLRAEYLWAAGRREALTFHFTNGQPFEWSVWREGVRPLVSGREVTWQRNEQPDESRTSFTGYMETLFRYGSVYSLHRDTRPVSDETVQPGDVFVVPGRPGQAVLVLDVATDAAGRVRALLGRGGAPSQTFHVLAAAPGSPWFELRPGTNVRLPDGGSLSLRQLRRW